MRTWVFLTLLDPPGQRMDNGQASTRVQLNHDLRYTASNVRLHCRSPMQLLTLAYESTWSVPDFNTAVNQQRPNTSTEESHNYTLR